MRDAKYYLEMMDQIDERVKGEEPAFRVLTPKMKIIKISHSIRMFVEKRKSANRYSALERRNPQSETYAKSRAESEYFECLASTRLRNEFKILDEYEMQLFLVHLRSKIEEGKIEKYHSKRYTLYEYVCVACSHCVVEDENIMNQIVQIREEASNLIKESPTM